MNTELLKQKMREYFDNISPEELITKFEKMGYSFVDVTPQSEPLPDSYGRVKISGSLLLLDLFQVAGIKNEDGMAVIEYIDKPNGGSVAYVRHDAMVNKLNSLLALDNQELAATSTVPDTGEDAIEVLKDIMLKFGNAHDMLAKSKLTKEEYQPISSLLAKGKIELFNFYQLYRKQSKQ